MIRFEECMKLRCVHRWECWTVTLRQFRHCFFPLDCRHGHLGLECWGMIPSCTSGHACSFKMQPYSRDYEARFPLSLLSEFPEPLLFIVDVIQRRVD